MDFELSYWPDDAEASKFRWDIVLADDEDYPAEEWSEPRGDFSDGSLHARWQIPPGGSFVHREFTLRAWFDCDDSGFFDESFPYRKIKVVVVGVDTLTATETLHDENFATSKDARDVPMLDICQRADGTAQLDFELSYLPSWMEGWSFCWDLALPDGKAGNDEWDQDAGDFAADAASAIWQPDDPDGAAREFLLRAWYDCEGTGTFDDDVPNRQIKIRVVDLDTLTATGVKGGNSVTDTTRTNEERTQGHTLYVAEETNGTAQVRLDLSWLPEGVDGSKFHYQILPEGDDAPSVQWDLADGTFDENSITTTCSHGGGGESNRIFTVNAWYDCNGNGEQDDDEPCRQLFIVVAKATYAIDHVCPKAPHDPHYIEVDVLPADEAVPVGLELKRVRGQFGEVIFADSDEATLDISGTATVTVMGTQYSDSLTNMALIARIGGAVCASNVFTVCDVGMLTAFEDRHATNSINNAQDGDIKVLDICQGPSSNGAALLNTALQFQPTNDNHHLFRSSFMLMDGTLATNQWYPAQTLFQNAVTNQTLWHLPDVGPTNREFLLHGWFDCDNRGVYSNNYPHRDVKVRVVELDKLTLTALPGNYAVSDVTRANEPMSASNTLYLAEGTNGMAQMKIEASWLPPTIPAERFRYEILHLNGSTSAQWQASSGTFGQGPVTVTWTNAAQGESNRTFKVNAWYDCNHNDTNDVDEPHRQLFVTVYKGEVTNIKFNYDTTTSTNDAINIRQDLNTPYDISNGEWNKNGTNLPVCYTTNRAISIKARITIQPASITNADVWAVAIGSGGSLGNVIITNVTFIGGISSNEYVLFGVSGTTPHCIQKTTNDAWQWKLGNINGTGSSAVNLNTSSVHAVYTIFTEPVAPWDNAANNKKNAWTKALDFVIDSATCKGDSTAANALVHISRFLHSGHGLTYDIEGGRPKYYLSGTFDLSGYIDKSSTLYGTAGNIVNCYDQAGGVNVSARLIGISAEYIFMGQSRTNRKAPFGYILATDLVGVGACNNPFYPGIAPTNNIPLLGKGGVTDLVDPNRSLFINHAFARYNAHIYDACAGPHLGAETLVQYATSSIDITSSPERQVSSDGSNWGGNTNGVFEATEVDGDLSAADVTGIK